MYNKKQIQSISCGLAVNNNCVGKTLQALSGAITASKREGQGEASVKSPSMVRAKEIAHKQKHEYQKE